MSWDWSHFFETTLGTGLAGIFTALVWTVYEKRRAWYQGYYVAAFERIYKYKYRLKKPTSGNKGVGSTGPTGPTGATEGLQSEEIPEEFMHGLACIALFGEDGAREVTLLECLETNLEKGEKLDSTNIEKILTELKRKAREELHKPSWRILVELVSGRPAHH